METTSTTDTARNLGGVARAAYVHVPFCAHKCGYCDFASVAGAEDRVDAYLDALQAEMAAGLGAPTEVDTIFIGGGTPTYISSHQLARLLKFVAHWLPLAPGGEFTVESNPNTLDDRKAAILAQHGVNRVSLGAQSFQPHLLERLERDHDPHSVGRAVDLLRPRVPRVSVDLIFGVPGQTFAEWRVDLECALSLGTEHLSAYSLTYEKGTQLWKQRRLGVVQPVDEELERSMFEWTIDRLADAGLDRYEISNFARSRSARCQHNLTYWRNESYFGFGTGAASYLNGERAINGRDLESYIAKCSRGESPRQQSERLEPEPRARETAMLLLRTSDGVDRASFKTRVGFEFDELCGPALPNFVAMGFLEDDGAGVRLTRAGLLVADGVIAGMLYGKGAADAERGGGAAGRREVVAVS